MRYINLTKGFRTIVDNSDYKLLSQYKWSYTQNGKKGYAIHASYRGRFYLHRFLLQCPAHLCVDHINGDSLDNRRSNLRICDRSLNNKNRAGTKNYSRHISMYKKKNGITGRAVGWVVESKYKDARIRLYFKTEKEAQLAAKELQRNWK